MDVLTKEQRRRNMQAIKGKETKTEIKLAKGLVKIKHKVYFTSIIGLVGLLTCVFAIWFFLQKKGILTGNFYLLLGLILTGIGYSAFILRDLNKNEVAIREVLERIWYDEYDETGGDEELE
ncbi:MAG: hypothetical protein ABI663_04100 [Chryseolinea sp.]